jgi:hypothetical protein
MIKIKESGTRFGIIGSPKYALLHLMFLHEIPSLIPAQTPSAESEIIEFPERKRAFAFNHNIKTYTPTIPPMPMIAPLVTCNTNSKRGGSPREWGERKYKKKRR